MRAKPGIHLLRRPDLRQHVPDLQHLPWSDLPRHLPGQHLRRNLPRRDLRFQLRIVSRRHVRRYVHLPDPLPDLPAHTMRHVPNVPDSVRHLPDLSHELPAHLSQQYLRHMCDLSGDGGHYVRYLRHVWRDLRANVFHKMQSGHVQDVPEREYVRDVSVRRNLCDVSDVSRPGHLRNLQYLHPLRADVPDLRYLLSPEHVPDLQSEHVSDVPDQVRAVHLREHVSGSKYLSNLSRFHLLDMRHLRHLSQPGHVPDM